MGKRMIGLFAIFLIIGMVFSFPLLIAQGNSGQGNGDDIEDNDSDDVDEEDIIDAIVSESEDTDDESEADDEDDETEIEIEIENENSGEKVKFRARNKEMSQAQIRDVFKNQNRIGHNSTNLPENCTRAGSTIKCNVQERLRTRVEVETNYPLPDSIKDSIYKIRAGFEGSNESGEVEIELDDEEVESEIEGKISDIQKEYVEMIVQDLSDMSGTLVIVEDDDGTTEEMIEVEIEIKHQFEKQRKMAIIAGQSGNVILQSKGVNASTNVELYHHNGKVYGMFGDNETRLIDLLPNEVKERVREHIRAQIEGNESIELDEDGEYRVEVRKRSRFLGLFKVKEKMQFEVDPQTGEVLRERAPWWGFLANDTEDENDFVSETNTTNTTDTNSSI